MRLFRSGKRRIIATMALIAGLAAVPALADEPAPDSFPGVWQVTVTPDEAATHQGKQVFGDLVLFENGQMSAEACAKYGFAPSSYTTSDMGSTFTTTMSCGDESITWSATTNGQSLTGTVTWNKPGGIVYQFSMRGSRFVEEGQDDSGESSN